MIVSVTSWPYGAHGLGDAQTRFALDGDAFWIDQGLIGLNEKRE